MHAHLISHIHLLFSSSDSHHKIKYIYIYLVCTEHYLFTVQCLFCNTLTHMFILRYSITRDGHVTSGGHTSTMKVSTAEEMPHTRGWFKRSLHDGGFEYLKATRRNRLRLTVMRYSGRTTGHTSNGINNFCCEGEGKITSK